jgi:hypothetical protein
MEEVHVLPPDGKLIFQRLFLCDGMVRREGQSWLNHCAAPPLLSTAGTEEGE